MHGTRLIVRLCVPGAHPAAAPPVHRDDWRQEAGLLVPTTWDQLVAAGQQFNQLKASQNLSDAWPLCLYPTCERVWGGEGAVA